MNYLGYLVWWRVSGVQLPVAEAHDLIPRIGFTVAPPHALLPSDAYRRLGDVKDRWVQDGARYTLALHDVDPPSKETLARHIVVTERRGDKVEHTRVGDVTFYRNPKGQPSKARLRVTSSSEPRVSAYADGLRQAYADGLGSLDDQAIRRLVRAHLAEVNALPMDGPYFMLHEDQVRPLIQLFGSLDANCSLYWMPVPESAHMKDQLGHAIEHAVTDGSKINLVEAYVPLGVVPETVWARLKDA